MIEQSNNPIGTIAGGHPHEPADEASTGELMLGETDDAQATADQGGAQAEPSTADVGTQAAAPTPVPAAPPPPPPRATASLAIGEMTAEEMRLELQRLGDPKARTREVANALAQVRKDTKRIVEERERIFLQCAAELRRVEAVQSVELERIRLIGLRLKRIK